MEGSAPPPTEAIDFTAPVTTVEPAPLAGPELPGDPTTSLKEEPVPTPEASPKKELSKERHMREIGRVGTTIQGDINRDLDGKTQDEQRALFNPEDAAKKPQGTMMEKIRIAHNMRSGTLTDRGPITDVDPPVVLHKQGDAAITSIDSKNADGYICRTADGTVVTVGFDEMADAQLILEKTTILAGLPDGEKAAMALYIESLASDDPAAALEGKTPAEINEAIQNAADSRALLTMDDAEALIQNQFLTDQEKLEAEFKTAGKTDADLATDTEYGRQVQALIDRAKARTTMVQGNEPANLLDAPGMTALLTDLSGIDLSNVDHQLSQFPKQLAESAATLTKLEAHLESIKGDSLEAVNTRIVVEGQIEEYKARIDGIKIEQETLNQVKELYGSGGVEKMLTTYTEGSATAEDRKIMKEGMNSKTPEDLLEKVTRIEEDEVKRTIKDRDEAEAAMHKKKETREHRVKVAKRIGIFGGLALVVFLLAAKQGGGH